jgi:hypothetical protein
VDKNGECVRVLANIPGKIVRNKKIVDAPGNTPEEKERNAEREKTWLQRRFNIYWVGIYPLYRIKVFYLVKEREKADLTPELLSIEKQLTEKLGTRVRIEQKEKGGKVLIDFFSPEDLAQLVAIVAQQQQARSVSAPMQGDVAVTPQEDPAAPERGLNPNTPQESHVSEEEDDLYSMRNFTV